MHDDPNANDVRDGVEERRVLPVDETSSKTILVAVAVAAAVFAVDMSLPLGVAGGVPYVALVLVGIWFSKPRHIYRLAILGSVLTITGYFASPSGGVLWVVLANRGLALFAIWITALLIASYRRAENALKVSHYLEEQRLELKQMADAATEARDAAETANRSKSEFLANMSHELRTPLNAVIGFSDMMRNELLGPVGNPQYLSYARDIHSSGEHLLGLINDILDISKIEAGKMTLDEKTLDLNEVVRTSLKLVKPRADASGVTIENLTLQSPHAFRGDDRKIKQIVINLLSNAVKFTPENGTVSINTDVNEHGGVSITIADSGIGIAPEDIEKVMKPFIQADSALSRKYEGTGLGLPLTKALVELHGGTLELSSELGVGTKATVRFPANRTAGGNDMGDLREVA